MHFWRVSPIEPTARFSSLATSVYGRAGIRRKASPPIYGSAVRGFAIGLTQHLLFLGLLYEFFSYRRHFRLG